MADTNLMQQRRRRLANDPTYKAIRAEAWAKATANHVETLPTTSTARTKLDILKEHWAKGEFNQALAIAAAFPALGKAKDAIVNGHDAVQHPDFYRQLKRDPEVLRQAGLEAIKAKYKL